MIKKKKKDRFPRSPWLESKLSRGPIYSLPLPKGPNVFFIPVIPLFFVSRSRTQNSYPHSSQKVTEFKTHCAHITHIAENAKSKMKP